MGLSERENGKCCEGAEGSCGSTGCGAVLASLVGATKLGLTQEFLREKPELGGFSSGRRARDSCVSQSPADLQDESLCCLIVTSVKMRSLWLLLRSLFGRTGPGKPFLTGWPPEQPGCLG